MTTSYTSNPAVVSPDHVGLRAAVSAYLGRYRGDSRYHTEFDLRIFLTWCTEQELEPLAAVRADIERYVRWLQDVRRLQPSTVSRRLSVVAASTASASATESCHIRQPTTSADRSCHPTHRAAA
jgi:hypothetical protein